MVQSAFEAIDGSHWDRLLDLFAPDVLEDLKSQYLRDLERSLANPALASPAGKSTIRDAYGTVDPDELRSTSARTLARRILPHHPSRFHGSLGPHSDAKTSRTVVGEVSESPDLVHVVYRLSLTATVGGKTLTSARLEVASVQRHGSTWLLRSTTDLQSPGTALGQWLGHESLRGSFGAAV